jgi:hypothetical protein
MAFPTTVSALPTGSKNEELSKNLHPKLHNDANAEINQIEAVLAPRLLDLVSIHDFDKAENGDGAVDDTAPFKETFAAAGVIGRCTIIIPSRRRNGESALWTVGKSEAGGGEKSVVVRIPSHVTVSAYGARIQALKESGGVEMKWKLFGTSSLNEPKEALTVENVRWFGGHFVGSGKEPEQQGCLGFTRSKDICVRDMKATKWSKEPTGSGGGVLDFGDNQRCRVESCTFLECSKVGGINVIQITDSYSGGSNELPFTEILVTNNIVTGAGASPMCIGMGSGSKYVNTNPVRIIISNNVAESTGWSGITVELGGNPPAEGNFHQISITNNHARTSATAGFSYGISCVVDSTPIVESATVIESILIANNVVDSTRFGINSMGSNTLCQDNLIKCKEKGIYFQSPTGVFLEQMYIEGGSIQVKEGNAVYMNKCIGGTCNVNAMYTGGGAGEEGGIYLQTCSHVSVESKVRNALGPGIKIEGGAGHISVLSGTRIYNCSTNGTKAGIEVRGEPTGPVYIIGAQAKDDRGGEAKMKYGIQNLSAGTKVFSLRNILLGWVTSDHNGTFAQKHDNTIDETGNLVGALVWKEVTEEVNAKLEASFSKIEYAVWNNIVYLRGSMKCKAGEEIAANAVLFKLPAGARPASTRLITQPTTEAVRAGKAEASGSVTCLNALKTGISIGFDGVNFAI